MSMIEDAILKLDAKLSNSNLRYVFLGGSVLSLLVTDSSAAAIRVTKDVDVMVNVKTRKDFRAAERTLEALGFRHDTREDAPICRWMCDGVTVDVLPIRQEVLGWDSRWSEEALAAPMTIICGGREIKVVSAPYFVALKLEAFEERGQKDFLGSTDFEDVICLFNGRKSIVEEIASCHAICSGLAAKFVDYLKSQELEDAVEGFVKTESNPEFRKKCIMDRFAKVAALVEPTPSEARQT